MEVVEKEEANFDTEISEEDVAGEWKLRGQVLMRSPVRYQMHLIRQQLTNTHCSKKCLFIPPKTSFVLFVSEL